MLNRLRYFFKKQKLAVALARCDLLFLLDGLVSFKSIIKPAAFFVKPSPLPIPCRLRDFLASQKGFMPDLLVPELSALACSRGGVPFVLTEEEKAFPAGTVMIRENPELCDTVFYVQLLAELIRRDFPRFGTMVSNFNNRLLEAEDMRLYAAALDRLLSLSADSQGWLPIQIDWSETSAEELYIEMPYSFVLTSKLNLKAQLNLASLFAHLLFEKSVFISVWESVAVAENGLVAFVDFDRIYDAGYEEKLSVFFPSTETESLNSLKLRQAMELLRLYCPEVNLSEVFAPYRSGIGEKTPFSDYDKDFLKDLALYGYGYVSMSAEPHVSNMNPSVISRLLKPKTVETSWLNKTAVLYWGPLIIVVLVLFMLFNF